MCCAVLCFLFSTLQMFLFFFLVFMLLLLCAYIVFGFSLYNSVCPCLSVTIDVSVLALNEFICTEYIAIYRYIQIYNGTEKKLIYTHIYLNTLDLFFSWSVGWWSTKRKIDLAKKKIRPKNTSSRKLMWSRCIFCVICISKLYEYVRIVVRLHLMHDSFQRFSVQRQFDVNIANIVKRHTYK